MRQTAVHVQRKMVKNDPHTISKLPLLLGPETQPVTGACRFPSAPWLTVEPLIVVLFSMRAGVNA